MGDPDDAILRAVGARIGELRRERGMTQEALSQRLEVSTKYLQRLEQGSENLTLRTLARVATELGVVPLLLMLPPMTVKSARVGRPALPRGSMRSEPVRRVPPRPGSVGVIPLYTMLSLIHISEPTRPY